MLVVVLDDDWRMERVRVREEMQGTEISGFLNDESIKRGVCVVCSEF